MAFTPWFKLIAESFLYKWWDALLERTAHSSSAAATAGVKADANVLRELVTEQDKNEIHRYGMDVGGEGLCGEEMQRASTDIQLRPPPPLCLLLLSA